MVSLFAVLEIDWINLGFRAIQVLILAFFAILFLQSGLEKVTDRKGNLEWLVSHFSKSAFKNIVPILLSVLTVMELLCGASAAISSGLTIFIELQGFWLPFVTVFFCIVTLLMLFTGQRIAKDYAGAAGIVPYLIMAFFALLLLMVNLLPRWGGGGLD